MSAVLVGGDGLALHDPFEGRLAVDDVFAGGERDVLDGNDVSWQERQQLVTRSRSPSATLESS